MMANDGIKQIAIRVNHLVRKPSSADLRRDEIELLLTEDLTGLSPEDERITELLGYYFTINLPTIEMY